MNNKRFNILTKDLTSKDREIAKKDLTRIVAELEKDKQGKKTVRVISILGKFSYFTLFWLKRFPPIGFLLFFLFGMLISDVFFTICFGNEYGAVFFMMYIVLVYTIPTFTLLSFLSTDKAVKLREKYFDEYGYGWDEVIAFVICK